MNLKNCSQEEIHFSDLSEQELVLLNGMQGECRVKEWQYLAINYPKAIFFAILLTLSIIGLLLLKYFRSLRAALFYTSLTES